MKCTTGSQLGCGERRELWSEIRGHVVRKGARLARSVGWEVVPLSPTKEIRKLAGS